MAREYPKLDRRVPTDFEHVEKYPASKLRTIAESPERVERRLLLPKRYVPLYDQGKEGACVGYGQSIMMSILNRRLYDAYWLYREAQDADEFHDTPPEEGTTLRAGFDVLRDKGHRQLWGGQSKPPKVEHGIVQVNRWLRTVDELRAAIASGAPVNLGLHWFASFYRPRKRATGMRDREESWIGAGTVTSWGSVAGGHCITAVGASDRREAALLLNSWGARYGDYGHVWIPYRALDYLLARDGEAAIVTDR